MVMFRFNGEPQNFFKKYFVGNNENLSGFKRLQNLSDWC